MKINYGQYEMLLQRNKLDELLRRSVERLAEIDFDTIAVCGVSGLLVGSPLAVAMQKSLLIVRKPGEPTRGAAIASDSVNTIFGTALTSKIDPQGMYSVLGSGNNQKILLLDDHVATGTTVALMVSAINKRCTNATFAGLFLYGEHLFLLRLYRDVFGYRIHHRLYKANGEPLELKVLTL